MVARLLTGALASVVLSAGPLPGAVSAHAMAPAVGFQSTTLATGLVPLKCQSAAFPLPCYGPGQIRAAYDVQASLDSGITGAGRKIVLIDGYQNPLVSSDLATFDAAWGLAPASLQIVAPEGLTRFNPADPIQLGWALEISTDVEWAHVIAPGAELVLVLAKTGSDADLLSAIRYTVAHNLGDVISMSFGEAESCPSAAYLADEHATFEAAVDKGITLVAASGDAGAAQHTCDGTLVAGVSTPASDPEVTGVGGTRLVADLVTGEYGSEVAWNDTFGASGGGFSAIYGRPSYQAPLVKESHQRGVPDVAWSADKIGGTPVFGLGRFGTPPGTSAGTAEWAGIAALADQAANRRLGSLNPTLYRLAKGHSSQLVLHDVTSGNNSFHGFTGFSAGPGWDAVTGLGSPDAAQLVAQLRGGEESASR